MSKANLFKPVFKSQVEEKSRNKKPVKLAQFEAENGGFIKMYKDTQRSHSLALKKNSLVRSSYFSDTKDAKSSVAIADSDKEVELLKANLDMARNAIKSGLKDRPIRIRLVAPFTITTTVTSGVTNTLKINGLASGAIDPSYMTEWGSFAGLFDEYKVLGGEMVFTYANPSRYPVVSNDQLVTMAYDSDSGTSASVSSLCEHSQHKSFNNAQMITGPSMMNAAQTVHRFNFHIPRGTAAGGAASIVPGTQWVVTGGPQPCGYILFYHVGLSIAAEITGAGTCYLDTEFRCRV